MSGQKKNVVWLLDVDGHLVHRTLLSQLEPHYFKDEKLIKPIPRELIIEHNKPLLDAMIQSAQEAERLEILSGSNRSTPYMDATQDYAFSSFPVLKTIVEESQRRLPQESGTRVEFYPYLFSDGCNDFEAGSIYNTTLPLIDDTTQRYRTMIQNSDYPNVLEDEFKVGLIYSTCHHLALRDPNTPLEVHFGDDRDDILTALTLFFEAAPTLLPSNITLHLHHYNGLQAPETKCIIQGQGEIDADTPTSLHELMNEVLKAASETNPEMSASNHSEVGAAWPMIVMHPEALKKIAAKFGNYRHTQDSLAPEIQEYNRLTARLLRTTEKLEEATAKFNQAEAAYQKELTAANGQDCDLLPRFSSTENREGTTLNLTNESPLQRTKRVKLAAEASYNLYKAAQINAARAIATHPTHPLKSILIQHQQLEEGLSSYQSLAADQAKRIRNLRMIAVGLLIAAVAIALVFTVGGAIGAEIASGLAGAALGIEAATVLGTGVVAGGTALGATAFLHRHKIAEAGKAMGHKIKDVVFPEAAAAG